MVREKCGENLPEKNLTEALEIAVESDGGGQMFPQENAKNYDIANNNNNLQLFIIILFKMVGGILRKIWCRNSPAPQFPPVVINYFFNFQISLYQLHFFKIDSNLSQKKKRSSNSSGVFFGVRGRSHPIKFRDKFARGNLFF